MIDCYDWAGGREAMLRFGPAGTGPVVVAAMPLLEEWNRTRAFVVALLRTLAEKGVASVLPDLPGHGESLTGLPGLPTLRDAMAAAAARAGATTVALGVRGGTLLDAGVGHRGRWHLSPASGADLRRDLDRVRRAGGAEAAAVFLDSLEGAEPTLPARVVRLGSDQRPADRHVDGIAPWRRAEAVGDPALAAVLVEDFLAWYATCAG